MCNSKLHLSEKDKDFLKSLRIKAWECSTCNPEKPKLRVEGDSNGRTDADSAGRNS